MGCGASTEFDPTKETRDEYMARKMYETYVKLNDVEKNHFQLHARVYGGGNR